MGVLLKPLHFFYFFHNHWHLRSKGSQPVVPALPQFSQFSLTGGNKTSLNNQLSLNALQGALRLPDVVTNMRRVILGGLDLSGQSVHLLCEGVYLHLPLPTFLLKVRDCCSARVNLFSQDLHLPGQLLFLPTQCLLSS